MHTTKMDFADSFHAINVGRHIGENIQSEIKYASNNGKSVTYLEETT